MDLDRLLTIGDHQAAITPDKQPFMPPLLQRAIAIAWDQLGHPVRLRHLLTSSSKARINLDLGRLCIDAKGVFPWHTLRTHPSLDNGTLLGREPGPDGHYFSTERFRPEYNALWTTNDVLDWTCDIADVHGFAHSRADLMRFIHTDAMAETRCQSYISEITHSKLLENLEHKGIRVVKRQETFDYFQRHAWDDRLWLINQDGSHHFAAAKYIAARLKKRVPLTGRLTFHAVNPAAAAALTRDFEMFAIPIIRGLFDALEKCRATWFWHPLPLSATREEAHAILLPRDKAPSMRAAHVFRETGIFNLGRYWEEIAHQQRALHEKGLAGRPK